MNSTAEMNAYIEMVILAQWTMDEAQKPVKPNCCTSSSEPNRICKFELQLSFVLCLEFIEVLVLIQGCSYYSEVYIVDWKNVNNNSDFAFYH
jgi:hypothetical protein